MKARRTIFIVILLAVIVGLGFWVKSRWTAWFVGVPETYTSYVNVPDRITLTPGENFLKERYVSWRCDSILLPSSLMLVHLQDSTKLEAQGAIVENRVGTDVFYKVKLENLIPGESYSYRVETNGNKSEWYYFSIPSKNEKLQIVYIGDVQDTINGTSGTLFKRLYPKFKNANLWAFGGDLIEAPVDKYWNYFFETTKEMMGNITMVCATGNHEYFKTPYRTLDPRWAHTFAFPDNGAKFMKERSYYIEDDNMLFITLDTNGLQDAITVASEYQWLKRVLEEKRAGKWVILMFHHPIFSVRAKRNNLLVRNTFLPLIKRYGVDLVLQGHEHGYSRQVVANDKGDDALFIVSHTSPKKYRTIESSESVKVIPNTEMYQTIELNGKELEYKAYDAWSDELLDSYKLEKNNQ